MDRIYAEAELTIIPIGDNLFQGIFGGSRERSLRQTHIEFNDLAVATTFEQSFWEFVTQSVWAFRGWTFQESLFSKRRVFFVDDQVFWDCAYGWGSKSCAISNLPEPVKKMTGYGYFKPLIWSPTIPS